jgi:serine/threonine-protein kinase
MLALYRCDRQAEALAAYRATRRMLDDELGIAPSRRLQELETAILRHASSLEAVRDRPVARRVEPPPPPPGPAAGERRPVTVLNAALLGADRLAGPLRPSDAAVLVSDCGSRMRRVVEELGGTVDSQSDDELCATFGLPATREDDTERAAFAALRLVEELGACGRDARSVWGVSGLCGQAAVERSEVIVDDRESVTRAASAARALRQAGPPGGVSLGPAAALLLDASFVAERWPLDPASPERGQRLVAINRPVPRPAGDGPLIGRAAELDRLRHLWRQAEAGRGQLLLLVGDAGIGKSRLLGELSSITRTGATWIQGHCPAYGSGRQYAAFADALRGWLGVGGGEPEIAVRTRLYAELAGLESDDVDEAAPFLAALLAVEPDAARARAVQALGPDELDAAIQRSVCDWLLALARRGPVVLAIEDLHVADPGTIRLARELLELPDRAPVSLVLTLRGDPHSPAWPVRTLALSEHSHRVSELALAPLPQAESAELLATLLAGPLDEASQTQIVARAEGNPLFISELLQALVESGGLERRRTWTLTVDPAALPTALEGLLVARIDRLDPATRRVAQLAAAAGRTVPVEALELADPGSDVAAAAQQLLRSQIMSEARRYPRLELTFRHGLLQQAALSTLGPTRRAELRHRMAAAMAELALAHPHEERARPPVSSAERPLASGDRLGPYRLEERLGEGAMGVVFRAVREPEGTIVALKVLRSELSGDEPFRRRFAHEARAARQVRHAHLVELLDAGELAGCHYLAASYVAGQTLAERLGREEQLGVDDVVRLAAELGDALDALHAAGVVHRDVKPSNILLDANGGAQLADFGLARGAAVTLLTLPGQVLGTIDYLAPELVRGEPASPASDLYAFACVLFECVAGSPPFGSRPLLEVTAAHVGEEPPDPGAERPDVPQSMSWILRRALAKEPADRPSSGRSFASLVARAAGAR